MADAAARPCGGSVPSEPVPAVDLLALLVASSFHGHYERLAPEFGYATRPESAVAWADVPEANRNLMVATARHVLTEMLTDYDQLLMQALWERRK